MRRVTLAVLLVVTAEAAQAYDFAADNPQGLSLGYTIIADSESPAVEVSGFAQKPEGDVELLTIPGSVTHNEVTYAVTAVGRSAFDYERIKSLKIEEGIRKINSYAFVSYTELEMFNRIELPSSLQEIDYFAFSGVGATTIDLPKSLTMINGAAFAHSSLKEIKVHAQNTLYSHYQGALYSKDYKRLVLCPPNCITSFQLHPEVEAIGDYAFATNRTLKTIRMPESVKSIGHESFLYSHFVSLDIPDSVIDIRWAFNGCDNLQELHFGAGVANIDFPIIRHCERLRSVTFSEENPNYSADEMGIYNKEKTALYCIFENYEGEVVVPSTVTTIGGGGKIVSDKSFMHFSSIVIPESVKEICVGSYLTGTVEMQSQTPADIKVGRFSFGSHYPIRKEDVSIIVPAESVKAYKEAWPDYEEVIYGDDFKMTIGRPEPLSTKKVVNVPISLENAENVIGFQCDVHLSYGLSIKKDPDTGLHQAILSDRASSTHTVTTGTPTDVTNIDGTVREVVRVICFSMKNTNIKGNDGVLFELPIKLMYDNLYWSMYIDNIILSKPGHVRQDVPPVGVIFSGLDYIPGDADDDGEVSVVDITASVDYIAGRAPEPFILDAADFDKDGTVTIVDVTSLIEMALGDMSGSGDQVQSSANQPRRATPDPTKGSMELLPATVEQNHEGLLEVSLSNEPTIVGFQCDITLPEGVTPVMEDDEYEFNLNPARSTANHMVASRKQTDAPNKYRVMSFSFSNTPYKGNEGMMFSFPVQVTAAPGTYDVELTRIILSAEGSVRVDLPSTTSTITVTDDTTGTAQIEVDVNYNGTTGTYDMMGRPVANPGSGIYIVNGQKVLRR